MTVKNIYPWGNFVIDDETGLPALPSPQQFWRVTKLSGGYWEVQLRERRSLSFSRKLASRTRNIRETPILEKWILDGAAHALTNYIKGATNNESLLGDYPPKKLES